MNINNGITNLIEFSKETIKKYLQKMKDKGCYWKIIPKYEEL